MKSLVNYINESLYVNEGLKDKYHKFKETVKKTFGKAYDPNVTNNSNITPDDILNAKDAEEMFHMIDVLGACIVLDGKESVVTLEVCNNTKNKFYGALEVRIYDKKGVFEVIYENDNAVKWLRATANVWGKMYNLEIQILKEYFDEAAFDIMKYENENNTNGEKAWNTFKKMLNEIKGDNFKIINTGSVNPVYYASTNELY